jgi:hypothetical protein
MPDGEYINMTRHFVSIRINLKGSPQFHLRNVGGGSKPYMHVTLTDDRGQTSFSSAKTKHHREKPNAQIKGKISLEQVDENQPNICWF